MEKNRSLIFSNLKSQYTKTQFKEIESQLSHPKGEKGIEIANSMNQSNIGMTKSSIDVLGIKNGDVILEIGHGNCGHLNYLLNAGKELKYIGLEISKTMNIEAQKQLNEIGNKHVEFRLYSGEKIPFEKESIDKVMTVNTLYFWKNPKEFLIEISRVLKKGGTCIVTFAHKEFMKTLPFVNEKFKLYTPNDVEVLVKGTAMIVKKNHVKKEIVRSKSGVNVERSYSVSVLIKNE